MREGNLTAIITVIIALFCALPLQGQVFKGLPFIRTFGTNDYKAGIQNWDITQDSRGMLYFANNFGLLEYDGAYWQTYPIKTGSKVRCLSLGSDGRIYTGLQGDFGFFAPEANGRWKYTSLADSLPPADRDFDETWKIYQLQNKVYFCSFRNIFVYDGSSIQIIHPSNPIEFTFLVNKRLYVQDWERGLTILHNNKLEPVREGELFRHKRIVAILPYNQETQLVVTADQGLFLYNGHSFSQVITSPRDVLSRSFLSCATRLQDGSFAIGTQNDGLFILNDRLELLQQLDKPQGLNDHTVLSLFQDRHQNLWAGHNHGLSYIELSAPFTLLDEKLQVPGSGYAADIRNDTLYLGTNNGLFAGAIDPTKGLNFEAVKNTKGQVYHISNQGKELLMGHHKGAFRINGLEAQPLTEGNGVWKFMRLHRFPDLMLEGSYSGFNLYQQDPQGSQQWNLQKHYKGFDESSRVFEEDREGNIWMTHGYKGVYRLSLNRAKDSLQDIRFYGQEQGLPSNVLNNVFKIGNELLFTAETGVYRYSKDNNRFQQDSSLTQVLGHGEHIHRLQQDANGKIYFIASSKLGSISQDSFGEWEADTSRFYKVLDLLNDDLDFLSILNNQNILFGAKEGFIHFNPSQSRTKTVPVEVHIRKVEINTPEDSILFGGNFWGSKGVLAHQTEAQQHKLPYAHNGIRFQYAAPFFDGLGHLNYQFFLEGFDAGWSNWGPQVLKEYTNLPEGSYTFRVRGKNIYGDTSADAVYHFEIAPPWFRSPLAYLSYSILAAGFFFIGIFFVDRKHKREKHLLARKQQRALNQKKVELQSLSKSSKEEISKLKHEKLESEIRHMNKELATSTMHIVTKNEFIGEIKQHLNSIIRDNEAKAPHKSLKRIIKEIDQNIATDKDWEQFQIHFDRVHGDFSKRLKTTYPTLTPQEMKLCAYLRLNLSTKEIAQLMHISVRGVEISRYRLRKKLGLERQENLLDFILSM